MSKSSINTSIKLNKKELKKILKLLEGLPNETQVEIVAKPTGIGSMIVAKIEKNPIEFDVSDYKSW